MITITPNMQSVQRLIERLKATEDEVKYAKRAAINATVKGLRTDAGRMIREIVQITKIPDSSATPKKIIESRIKLFFADANALHGKVAGGRLIVKDSRIPIRWFGPKQSPKVVAGKRRSKKKSVTTAKVFKGGSRQVFPRGFGPNQGKLGYTIWERQGSSRLPLVKEEGIDIASLLRQRGGERRLKESANQRLQKNLVRRIQRVKYARQRTAKQ